MILENKTAYRAKTQEQFNKILKQADKQGIKWLMGDRATDNDTYWNCRKQNTVVCVDADSLTTWSEELAQDSGLFKIVDFVEDPSVVEITPNCYCVDAPDYETAYNAFKEYTEKAKVLPVETEECYTVTVKGRDVTVVTPDGKTATAQRGVGFDDGFDVLRGIEAALNKIKMESHKLTKREDDVLDFLYSIGCDGLCVCDEDELVGVRDGDEIITLEGDVVDGLFDWLDVYEDYNIEDLMDLDVDY